MKRYRKKGFTGLIPYGKARHAMYRSCFDLLSKGERKGYRTALENIEARAAFQRRFRRAA